MKKFLSKVVIGIIVAFVAASFGFSVQAAEKNKITVTKESKRHISRTTVNLGDTPKHQLVQFIRLDTGTSSNPDFNDTEQLVYGQSDQVAGSGSHRGHTIVLHKSGDESYAKWEGTHKTTVKEDKSWETSIEGEFQFTGGTGKFKNIKGGGTYKGKMTAEGLIEEVEMEVEY